VTAAKPARRGRPPLKVFAWFARELALLKENAVEEAFAEKARPQRLDAKMKVVEARFGTAERYRTAIPKSLRTLAQQRAIEQLIAAREAAGNAVFAAHPRVYKVRRAVADAAIRDLLRRASLELHISPRTAHRRWREFKVMPPRLLAGRLLLDLLATRKLVG
jgi:hypothetical protein